MFYSQMDTMDDLEITISFDEFAMEDDVISLSSISSVGSLDFEEPEEVSCEQYTIKVCVPNPPPPSVLSENEPIVLISRYHADDPRSKGMSQFDFERFEKIAQLPPGPFKSQVTNWPWMIDAGHDHIGSAAFKVFSGLSKVNPSPNIIDRQNDSARRLNCVLVYWNKCMTRSFLPTEELVPLIFRPKRKPKDVIPIESDREDWYFDYFVNPSPDLELEDISSDDEQEEIIVTINMTPKNLSPIRPSRIAPPRSPLTSVKSDSVKCDIVPLISLSKNGPIFSDPGIVTKVPHLLCPTCVGPHLHRDCPLVYSSKVKVNQLRNYPICFRTDCRGHHHHHQCPKRSQEDHHNVGLHSRRFAPY
jgi:hypothetical protein